MSASGLQYSAEPCWSRRTSIETIESIQEQETDFVRDSSDDEALSDGGVEYEPCTEDDDDAPTLGDSSGQSDNEIISTKVVEVSVGTEGELEFADSEQTASESDSEVDLCDYWRCAQCGARNNNPLYRYCERCFKVRKSFFPPRPKGKRKVKDTTEDARPLSQDSGIGSQEIHHPKSDPKSGPSDNVPESDSRLPNEPQASTSPDSEKSNDDARKDSSTDTDSDSETDIEKSRVSRKRRAKSADRQSKKARPDVSLTKTVSDPSILVEDVKMTKKVISDTIKEIDKDNNMCIVCLSEPKSGVFVHGRIAHICCCYKCAVKVWAKTKRCPVCNCKVSNVLKAVVM